MESVAAMVCGRSWGTINQVRATAPAQLSPQEQVPSQAIARVLEGQRRRRGRHPYVVLGADEQARWWCDWPVGGEGLDAGRWQPYGNGVAARRRDWRAGQHLNRVWGVAEEHPRRREVAR